MARRPTSPGAFSATGPLSGAHAARGTTRPGRGGLAELAQLEEQELADREAARREEELRSALKGAFEDACSHSDEYLAPDRQRAQDYYDGLIYTRRDEVEDLDGLEGRSTMVSREVADIIHQMLPGIVRLFTAGERVVDFVPRGPDDEEVAAQQTDYVNYCLDADGNSWFATLHDAVHDALLKKAGIIRWWWDSRTTVEEANYSGLDPMQLEALEADPAVEVIERNASSLSVDSADMAQSSAPQQTPGVAAAGPGTAAPGVPAPAAAAPPAGEGPPSPPAGGGPPLPGTPPATPLPMPPNPMMGGGMIEMPVFDVRIRRKRVKACLRIAAIPPEEFVIDRGARAIDTATYCAHRTLPTVSDLVSLGLADREVIEDLARESMDFDLNNEAQQRNPARQFAAARGQDKTLWRVLHVEHFIRYDGDDDGIAELHRIVTLGDACEEIVDDEVISETPVAIGSPVRLPHAVIGSSIADQTLDLQDLKTGVLRAVMDSLAEALDPRTAVVESAVEMSDVLNAERGAVIRMKTPGAVQLLQMPFIGTEALGVMQYLDMVKGQRTGISAASTGLSPEVLQSTTKSAADNTIERSQERVEMIARTLSETLVKQVFRGVLRTICRHQDKPRTVRLRGQWVTVDPRFWDAECDVQVNVALGRGPDSNRMLFLGQIAQKQEMILQLIGPDNPLVGIRQLRHTYAEMLRMAGFKSADQFFMDPTPQDEMAAKQAAAQNKPVDPQTALANAEIENGKLDAQVKVRAQQLEQWKAQQADDRERDKLDAEIFLRSAEIQAKHGSMSDSTGLRAQIDADRNSQKMQADVALKQREQDMGHERAMQDQAHSQGLAQQGQAHAQTLAEQQADRSHQLQLLQAARRHTGQSSGDS